MAASFVVRSANPERVAATARSTLDSISRPSAGIVFVSGSLSHRLDAVADAMREHRPGVPIVIVSGAGVLTERGEIEEATAAAGIVWSGGQAETVPLVADDVDDIGEALLRTLADRTSKTAPTVVVFANPEGFGPMTLAPLREARGSPHLFGGGTVGSPGAASIGSDGEVQLGPLALILRGMAPPAIRTSHSCRLLSPLKTITDTRGATVLTIDNEPALDVLSELGRSLTDQPLVFTVLAEPPGSSPEQGGRPELVIRGVQGVDPARRSLLISDEVYEGMRITFAVRDPVASRDDLEAVTRELERDIAGAAPRFALYINCAGRGVNLYSAHDVDTKILKGRFGDIPIAGMQSAFEIAPHLGKPTLQLYTGVLALFTAPS